MATDEERAQELYDQLKPEAEKVYIDHIASRTPPELHDEVKALAEADLAGGGEGGGKLTDSQVIINMGDSVRVVTMLGGDVPGSPGTAAVTSGNLDFIQLQEAAGQAQSQAKPQPQRQITPRR